MLAGLPVLRPYCDGLAIDRTGEGAGLPSDMPARELTLVMPWPIARLDMLPPYYSSLASSSACRCFGDAGGTLMPARGRRHLRTAPGTSVARLPCSAAEAGSCGGKQACCWRAQGSPSASRPPPELPAWLPAPSRCPLSAAPAAHRNHWVTGGSVYYTHAAWPCSRGDAWTWSSL